MQQFNKISINLSVIIPVFNEANTIAQTLKNLQSSARGVEIMIVDGGSRDQTIAIAQDMGAKVIISPQPGRAMQMNTGAQYATGNILLFLHADTQLPPNYPEMVEATLNQPHTIAGAFPLQINSPRWSLRIIEKSVNARSRWLQMPYGDQAIFLQKETFHKLGGFPNVPIMEDFQFIQTVKKQGKIRLASQAVLTSARRWETLGVLKTTLINQLIILGYWFGISPIKLKKWYHR